MVDPIRYFRPIWPVLGEVRISTLVMAVLMVLLVCWRRRSPIGIAVMFGWASLYETIDGLTGLLLHHYSLSYLVWSTAAYGGWLALLLVMRIYPERLTTLAFGLLWMVWIATGFHANVTGGDFVLRDELLNEGTKSLLGVAFVLGALRLDLLSTLKRRWLSGAHAVSWRALTQPTQVWPARTAHEGRTGRNTRTGSEATPLAGDTSAVSECDLGHPSNAHATREVT